MQGPYISDKSFHKLPHTYLPALWISVCNKTRNAHIIYSIYRKSSRSFCLPSYIFVQQNKSYMTTDEHETIYNTSKPSYTIYQNDIISLLEFCFMSTMRKKNPMQTRIKYMQNTSRIILLFTFFACMIYNKHCL